MAGTLLRTDWQNTVKDELSKHAQGLYETAQRGLQIVQDVPRPDPNEVLQQLQSHVEQVAQPVQDVVQFGQQQAQQVQQQLQDYATGLTQMPQPITAAGAEPFVQSRQEAAPIAGAEPAGGSLQDYARQAALKAGVDPEIFVRQIQQESGFNPNAKSPAGAQGIAQIVPQYHPGVDTSDPYASLEYGARLMGNHLRAFGGDYAKALAAYNAGPGAVQKYGGVPPFEETQRYVRTIMGGGEAPLHEASTPRQTPGTQLSNTPDADGRVFPLTVKPSNRPDATYHSEGGSDLMAPRGTPVLNMRAGTVTSVYTDNGNHQAGGNAVMIRGDDGLDYYYAHFDQPTGLKEGQRVDTGMQIGAVGNSGNAWKGGQGDTHLHIGIGKGISNGVGSEGGLGREFNAQQLLTNLQSGIGQATTTVAAAMREVMAGDQRPAARAPLYVGGTDEAEQQAASVRQPFQIVGDQAVSPVPAPGFGYDPSNIRPVEPPPDLPRRQDVRDLGIPPQPTIFEQAGERIGRAVQELPESGLADQLLRAGRTRAEQAEYGVRQQEELERMLAESRARQDQPITAGDVAGAAIEGAKSLLPFGPGPSAPGPAGVVQPRDIAETRERINQGIEHHPAFQDWPVPVAAGVGIMATQMLLDPMTYQSWGPLLRAGGKVGDVVTATTGKAWLGKLSASAVTNGLQNALYEAQRPDADPLEVGKQFALGAGFGSGLEFGVPALVKAGRAIMGNVDQLGPLLRSGARGEAEAGFAMGLPTGGRAPVAGLDAVRERHPNVELQVSERPEGIVLSMIRTAPDDRGTGLARAAMQDVLAYADAAGKPVALTPERVGAGGLSKTGLVDWYKRLGFRSNTGGRADFRFSESMLREPVAAPTVPETAGFRAPEVEPPTAGERVPSAMVPPSPERVQSFHPGLRPVVAGEAPLYHGGIAGDLADDRPTFLTSDRDAAQWYATERGGEGGRIREVAQRPTNPASIDELQDAAQAVGVTAEDIARHSQYGGENPLDLTFVPSVRRELERRGFDSVVAWDAITNREVPVAVIWRRPDTPVDVSGRRARGEANLPFSLNVGGAAAGGYAGYAATPEDAPLEEKVRNVGIGMGTGLLATRAITGRTGGRLAEALARRGDDTAGFRAPDQRPTLEDQLLQARTGPRAPGPPQEPRTLGEVHSNRYLLNEPTEGATPMTDDELMAHAEQLEQRFEGVRGRLEAIDEQLRNPTEKVYRPDWAAGWSNTELIEIARRHGVNAYSERWWETAGLLSGSGEVRLDVGESGLRNTGKRESSPTELRAELRTLQQEQADLEAAYDQLTSAPAGARFTPRPEGAESGDLPFDVGTEEAAPHGPFAVEGSGPSGVLADDIVTNNGTKKKPSGLKTLWSDATQVVGKTKGVTGRGVADAESAGVAPPTEETLRAMPNLDALLKDEVPDEVRVQIQKAVEDNPELFEAYNQGRISHDSLKDDLARKVGMTTKDWLATKVGQGFSTPELVALQAAAVDSQHGVMDMAREIIARQGVDNLTPEEVAFSLSNLFDTTRLLAVARGARATQGRSLNALKIRMDRTLSRGITGANEKRAAQKTAAEAKRAALKATQTLNKTRDLEQEAAQAATKAREAGLPKNILQQIDDAYAELDRYTAMSLHEKADAAARLAKERAERAAARKAKVRDAPEELLSALKAELAAERKIFAGRKDTWETLAFWDSKAAEQAAEKRTAFRGGLYIEQQRKAANDAAKLATREAEVAWERASKLESHRTERAKALLEGIGGEAPSRELLKAFVEAVASPDPMVAAKFLKGLQPKRSGFAGVVEMARNANIMRLAGMLSATATHLVNMGGSVMKAGLAIPEHALTVAIDIPRAKLTGGERQAYAAELGPMLSGWMRTAADADGQRFGLLSALPDMLRMLRGDVKGALTDSPVGRMMATGIAPSEVADLSKIRPGFRSSDLPVVGYGLGKIPGRVAENVIDPTIEMPLRALQAEDLAFRSAAFGMHASRVAIREATREGFRGAQRTGRANSIIANLEDYPELYSEAAESAAHMVFQERRTVPGMSNVRLPGTAGQAGEVVVSQVMPFRKTPINITAQGLGYSPLGIGGIAEAIGSRGDVAAKVATGEVPASRMGKQTLLAEQRAARATIGSAILGAMYMLGTQQGDNGKSKGNLTAMYDEDEASTYPQGWRAWSFRTENPATGEIVYTPFQNFGHAGVPMAMAAILADAERRGKKVWSDDKEMGRAVAGIGRYALDTPFLQGLSDVVELFHDPGRAGTKFIEGLVGSYGPYSGMGRQIQRAQGVASRNPREGFLMLVDALEANYPGLSGNVPEATTPLGDPRTPGATGFGALVGRYDIERDEPTLQVLREHGIRVPKEPKAIQLPRGYHIELTEAERDQLKRLRGQEIRTNVEAMVASSRYQRAESSLRAELLKQARDFGTKRASALMQDQLGTETILRRREEKELPESYYLGEAAD